MPFAPSEPEEILPFAGLVHRSGAHRLWQGQAPANDPHQTFTFAAASGFRVPVGIGVALMPFRHPYDAALQAANLAQTMGRPVTVGYGPGAADLQRGLLGAPYARPLAAAREYLTVMRGLLEKGSADHVGEYYTCRAHLWQIPRPPVEIGLGVLRPRMARLAGEVADVAITWLTPASYLRSVVIPQLRAGAEAAGRPVPRLVAMVPLALAGPGRDGAEFALESNEGHMRLPHYADMLRRSGIDLDMTAPRRSAEAVIAGGAFVYGELERVVAELRAFEEAGVDDVVLNVTGVWMKDGAQGALAELETVLGALG
ncbi:LLM class flavin-dependent oxidoreductase [Streptomyces sp. NPDC101227]|uniref:LLM class flavin-dependent oxidoreductase n=1 Tax=Streptomyces sp. NPDC101227 TaxID=3366136 RepID=UPI00381FEDA6